MKDEASDNPTSMHLASKSLASFVLAIGIMTFFGYALGKDMALRDNKQEAAINTAK